MSSPNLKTLEKKVKSISNSLRSTKAGLSKQKSPESPEAEKWRQYAMKMALDYRRQLEEICEMIRKLRG